MLGHPDASGSAWLGGGGGKLSVEPIRSRLWKPHSIQDPVGSGAWGWGGPQGGAGDGREQRQQSRTTQRLRTSRRMAAQGVLTAA